MIFRVGFVQLDSVNDPTAMDLVLLPLNLVNSQVLRVATKDTIGCNKRDGYVFCYRLLDTIMGCFLLHRPPLLTQNSIHSTI